MMYGDTIQVLRGDQYQVISTSKPSGGESIAKTIVLTSSSQAMKNDNKLQQQKGRNKTTLPSIGIHTKSLKNLSTENTNTHKETPTTTMPDDVDYADKPSKKRPLPLESRKSASSSSSVSAASVAPPNGDDADHCVNDDEWQQIQLSWSLACRGVILHPLLCRALFKQQFSEPTPIQAATLTASTLGRRNVVGAAPTGSGKTLAFLLPILQAILSSMEEEEHHQHVVRALIVTPTRELATQIYIECEKLTAAAKKRLCVTLVGGIAPVKQARLLSTLRPPILVGTPGRLWQMVRGNQLLLKVLSLSFPFPRKTRISHLSKISRVFDIQ